MPNILLTDKTLHHFETMVENIALVDVCWYLLGQNRRINQGFWTMVPKSILQPSTVGLQLRFPTNGTQKGAPKNRSSNVETIHNVVVVEKHFAFLLVVV